MPWCLVKQETNIPNSDVVFGGLIRRKKAGGRATVYFLRLDAVAPDGQGKDISRGEASGPDHQPHWK